MQLLEVVECSERVAETSGRLAKIAHLTETLRRLAPDEAAIGVAYLCGRAPQGKLGVGPALLKALEAEPPQTSPPLSLREVDAVFAELAGLAGKGSAARRRALLSGLFGRSTARERSFLARLALGEVRQGALEAIVLEAVARAAEVSVDRLRRAVILDGEVLALRDGGRPAPFQVTMRRFGRRSDVERLRRQLPLSPFFFDLLHLDGDDLIDEPGSLRAAALREALPGALRIPRELAEDDAQAQRFLRRALDAGHEGIMIKSLSAPYVAGARGAAWRKLKPAHSLDLVILAAEWGSGRRRGWLSNLHLGARDPCSGSFIMLGKTFKGLTDATLQWQTEKLLELEIGREGSVVHVRPELVVEIAFNDVQQSPHYPAGLALRFARVKGYRPDKRAADADTLDTVRHIRERSLGSQRGGA